MDTPEFEQKRKAPLNDKGSGHRGDTLMGQSRASAKVVKRRWQCAEMLREAEPLKDQCGLIGPTRHLEDGTEAAGLLGGLERFLKLGGCKLAVDLTARQAPDP